MPKHYITLNHRYFITESTASELREKVSEGKYREILSKFQILHFNDLYTNNPNLCPTYYFWLSHLYNPANIGNFDFYEHLFAAKRIKEIKLSEQERANYEKARRISSSVPMEEVSEKQKKKIFKSSFYRILTQNHAKTLKKEKKAHRDKHPALMNDIKSFTLILLYSVTKRENVVYFTADGDPVTFISRFLDSLSMRLCLSNEILLKLTDENKREILKGKTFELYIPYIDFVQKRKRVFSDMCSDWWKKEDDPHPYFFSPTWEINL